MKTTLKSIDPVSAGKISALTFAIIQLVETILLLIAPPLYTMSIRGSPNMMVQGVSSLGLVSIIVFPILGLIFGFIIGAVLAIVYNFLASLIGGIKLEMK
ncbi:MAG: hypothetical protein KGH64_00140 [Candidatus Micrarchaeota archaeon]|nr:hypothetical protein [Candidatus Micrarchaeota archaeon]MDE1860002.1 hypothetical protein [Candidatus Micrarchaeota archaeon]